jgi:predicted nucleotidyltransferase
MARIDDVIATLRAHQEELRRRGVLHAGIFGSVARGEDTERSDVDVAIELDEENVPDLWEYLRLDSYLSGLLGRRVDVADRATVRQRMRQRIERDYVSAF